MYNGADNFSERIYRTMDRFLGIGIRPGMTAEQERELSNANLLFVLVFILGLIMMSDIVQYGLWQYSPIAIITIAGSAGGAIYSIRTGHSFLPSIVLVAGLSLFFLVLVATGGSTNTGFVWVFVFPMLHFFTFSFRVGLTLFLSVLAGLAIILLLPGQPLLSAKYSDVMRHRIFFAYLFIGCASIASEFIQWRAQQKIDDLMARLVELSSTDQLTGLYNRRAFLERVDYERKRSLRDGFAMSLIMLDIDHFKAINDRYGHNRGDIALKALAECLCSNIRQQDTPARWGGEEFILLLPETGEEGAAFLAESLRREAERLPIECNGESFSLTVSLGVCRYDLSADPDDNIGCADQALYEAKRLGRNRVCVGGRREA